MPRYFFDVDDGFRVHSDDVGVELPDMFAARDAAARALAGMAKDHKLGLEPDKNLIMWVRNENGFNLLSLSLNVAMRSEEADGST